MGRYILFLIPAVMLFTGQMITDADAATAAAAKQQNVDAKASASGNPMDKVSREDVLDRVNGILSHNPQILEMLPEIKKEMKGKTTVFRTSGKEMESLSKDELIAVLKKINPALLKLQQERLKKQNEQMARQIQQNMQIQRMAQQQSQMKPPTVYTPPAKQPTPPTPYRPPAAQPAPPRR